MHYKFIVRIFVGQMTRWTSIFFILFFHFGLYAEMDSTWLAIKNMPLDEAKIEASYQYVKQQKLSRWDTIWIKHSKEMIAWTEALNADFYRSKIESRLFIYFNYHQKPKLSFKHAIQCISYAQKADSPELTAHGYRALATYYRHTGASDSSLHYYQLSEDNFKKVNLNDELWRCHLPRAEIHAEANNLKLAEELFDASWASVKDVTDRAAKGYVLWMCMQHYARNKNDKRFSEYLNYWIEFENARTVKMSAETARLHSNMLPLFSPDYKMAEREILAAIAYHRKQNNSVRCALFGESLGELYIQNEDFDKAIKALNTAEVDLIASKRSDPSMLGDILKLKYETFKTLNEPQQALTTLELYSHLQDSLAQEGTTKKLQDLEKKYEAKSLEVELNKKKIALRNSEIKKNILVFSLIGLLVGGFFIFHFLQKLSKSREEVALKEHALQEKIIEDLTKQKQVSSLHAMIEGQEKERLRIARDLHDGLGSYLTSIKVNFNELKPESRKEKDWMRVNELIDQACVEVRKISHNMMPHALSLAGIEGAVEDLGELLHKNGITGDIEIIGNFEGIEEEKAIMLYRILQELTNNIVKHSGATTALIQLIQHGNEISLIAEDNGCGFDTNNDLGDGIGLRNLKARIEYLGGILDVDSAAGDGTTITIRIPTIEIKE